MRQDLVTRFSDVRILVIGDWMSDVWIEGTAERLSPEAPVPVFLHPGKQRVSEGGAGNMANCAEALGCHVVRRPMSRIPGMLLTAPWPTRTRYVVNGHQLLRVDDDSLLALPVTLSMETEYAETITWAAKDCDIIAVSDYGQGAITRMVVGAAVETGKPVVVDPARSVRVSLYVGVNVIKPNRTELSLLSNSGEGQIADMITLNSRTGASVVTTLGAEGMMLLGRDGKPGAVVGIPGHDVPVADVTGAGDAAMAALCAGLAAGGSLLQAAEIANLVASLSVQRPGTTPVSQEWLINEMRAM